MSKIKNDYVVLSRNLKNDTLTLFDDVLNETFYWVIPIVGGAKYYRVGQVVSLGEGIKKKPIDKLKDVA